MVSTLSASMLSWEYQKGGILAAEAVMLMGDALHEGLWEGLMGLAMAWSVAA